MPTVNMLDYQIDYADTYDDVVKIKIGIACLKNEEIYCPLFAVA